VSRIGCQNQADRKEENAPDRRTKHGGIFKRLGGKGKAVCSDLSRWPQAGKNPAIPRLAPRKGRTYIRRDWRVRRVTNVDPAANLLN
jgi:hypothetical protein